MGRTHSLDGLGECGGRLAAGRLRAHIFREVNTDGGKLRKVSQVNGYHLGRAVLPWLQHEGCRRGLQGVRLARDQHVSNVLMWISAGGGVGAITTVVPVVGAAAIRPFSFPLGCLGEARYYPPHFVVAAHMGE